MNAAVLKTQEPEEPLKKKLRPTKMLDFFRKKSLSPTATSRLPVPPPLSNSLLPAGSTSPALYSVYLPLPHVDDGGDTPVIINKPVLDATAEAMLRQLWLLTSRLPTTVPIGTSEDKFACFHGDPCEGLRPGEDAWETLVHPALVLIGYNKQSPLIAQDIRRGKWGMDGFCQWIEVCVRELKVSASLLEMKLDRLCDAMRLL